MKVILKDGDGGPEVLKPGTPVVVLGYPSTRNQHEMRAERITVAGKTVELR